jgi:hypothetical protein
MAVDPPLASWLQYSVSTLHCFFVIPDFIFRSLYYNFISLVQGDDPYVVHDSSVGNVLAFGGADEKYVQNFKLENLKGHDLADLGLDTRVILKSLKYTDVRV